jgi:hypothetical protein
MDQHYMAEVDRILDLCQVLQERAATLSATIHQFGGTLQQVQQQAPPSFQIVYNPDADEHSVMMASL